MILLLGVPTEAPIIAVARGLRDENVSYVLFNQRSALNTEMSLHLRSGFVEGSLSIEGRRFDLNAFTGVYARLTDFSVLPEVERLRADDQERVRVHRLYESLYLWLDHTAGRVVNRPSATLSNGSKPYQAQLIESAGLATPPTLITNDPRSVRAFAAKHGKIIYKSISGVRSIVQQFDKSAASRLERIGWCPTQFQAFIPGDDVRVHVIGRQVFATAIRSACTDYRYASRQGADPAELSAMDLDPETSETCRRLAVALGLAFAGIDLKITPNGKVYCFEVNPCPAFTYYEDNTGQPIARAVARWLASN